MREIRVLGHVEVTVSTVIKVKDDVTLTEDEIYKRAQKAFSGISSYFGNGGDDKLIGVSCDKDTIFCDEKVEFDDYMEE